MEAALAPAWPEGLGTFVVLLCGYEDARSWLLIAGAREWLVDGNLGFVEWDAPALLVDKRTGELTRLVVVEHLDRLARMVPAARAAGPLSNASPGPT